MTAAAFTTVLDRTAHNGVPGDRACTCDGIEHTARCRRTRRPLRLGAADALALLTGMMPFGLVVGITAAFGHTAGVDAYGASALLFAGTAEMAGFAQIALGTAPLAAIATIVVVNARILLYGAALEERFRPQPAWFRWLAPMLLVDQTYATTVDKAPEPAAAFRRYWLALGLTVLLGWSSSIGIGMIIGPVLPAGLPLEAAGTACMLGLLVPRLADRTALAAAATAAVAGFAGTALPAGSGILVASACGLAAGAIVRRTAASR